MDPPSTKPPIMELTRDRHQDEHGNPIPVPLKLWATFPAEAKVVILLMAEQIGALQRRIEELEEQLRANSTNSSKPPSADLPGTRKKGMASTGRRSGGQPGHKGHSRSLLPPEQVTHHVDCYPAECKKCGSALPQRPTGMPVREQVLELPRIEPSVTEYLRHKVACPCCTTVTTGTRPSDAPGGAFGPRLLAFAALLTSRYRMSRRDIEELLRTTLGIDISLGSVSANEARVSEALVEPTVEVHAAIQAGEVAHVDDTTFLERNHRAVMWGLCNPLFAAYFVTSRKDAATAKTVLGSFDGILMSDRAANYGFYELTKHQTCLAHLDRTFLKISQRSGPSRKVGEAALAQMDLAWRAWHEFKADQIDVDELLAKNAPVERKLEVILKRGARCGHSKTQATCANILDIYPCLWLYTYLEGVEPTNNSAEQALRPGVRWRRVSFGSQSERGSRFVERMLTVIETCRRQGRHLLEFLTSCVSRSMRGLPAPSILPVPG